MHRGRSASVVAVTLLVATGCSGTPTHASLPGAEAALERSKVVVESGETSDQYQIASPPPDTTYDLRTFTSTAYPSESLYPLSFGKGSPGVRTVVVGGTVRGTAPDDATWQDLKDNDDGAALLMIGEDAFASYNLRADDVFDMFRPRPPKDDLNGATFLIAGCRGSTIRDDAVENDDEMTGTIRDCVFDGVNSGVSIGQNQTNPDAVTTIEDSTFIFRPMPNTKAPDDVGHGVLFKQMGGGRVVMHDVLVCYTETPIAPDRLTNWMPGTYDNVTIVLGPSFDGNGDGDVRDLDYPGDLPEGVTQTRDWSRCDRPSTGPTDAEP